MNADAPASLAPADTPGALQPLQELPLPTPVTWAPQTAGWAVVAFVLLLALLWGAWAGWRQHRKQRYRRIALADLDKLEAALQEPAQRAAALSAIPPLLKRTSLAVASRERVASLGGDEWLMFLKRTRGRFDERTGALLAVLSYAPAHQIAAVSEHDAAALVKMARDWIELHHVEI